MANYYDVLGEEPTATAAELQSAWDGRYTELRRLVTHHDPTTVNQANQGLQTLESIRAALLDPSARAAYDAGIGLGNVGGLADLDALFRQAGQNPPLGKRDLSGSPTAEGAERNSGLWMCPSCETDNPPHTVFCLKCGTQLLRECPECGQTSSLVVSGFCGQCGYGYDIALQRAEVKARLDGAQNQFAALDKQLDGESLRRRKRNKDRLNNGGTFLFWGLILMWVASSYEGSSLVAALAALMIVVGAITIVMTVLPPGERTVLANQRREALADELKQLVQTYDQLATHKRG